MDKGIFYLVCTIVIVAVVLLTGARVIEKVESACVAKVVYVKVPVTPTVAPSATPSATIAPLRSNAVKTVTVAPTAKAVVK